jgi:hypothetical protein
MTIKIGYPGKKSEGEVTTKMLTMKKNKPTISNKREPLRQAETAGNSRHEGQDPAPRITNLRRLTCTTEHVANRLIYILKMINTDTIKIMKNWINTK